MRKRNRDQLNVLITDDIVRVDRIRCAGTACRSAIIYQRAAGNDLRSTDDGGDGGDRPVRPTERLRKWTPDYYDPIAWWSGTDVWRAGWRPVLENRISDGFADQSWMWYCPAHAVATPAAASAGRWRVLRAWRALRAALPGRRRRR